MGAVAREPTLTPVRAIREPARSYR